MTSPSIKPKQFEAQTQTAQNQTQRCIKMFQSVAGLVKVGPVASDFVKTDEHNVI